MQNMKLVQTTIPEEHKDFLIKQAKDAGCTIATYLRMIIFAHVKSETAKSGEPQLAQVK